MPSPGNILTQDSDGILVNNKGNKVSNINQQHWSWKTDAVETNQITAHYISFLQIMFEINKHHERFVREKQGIANLIVKI